jgi:hypothetical protein
VSKAYRALNLMAKPFEAHRLIARLLQNPARLYKATVMLLRWAFITELVMPLVFSPVYPPGVRFKRSVHTQLGNRTLNTHEDMQLSYTDIPYCITSSLE